MKLLVVVPVEPVAPVVLVALAGPAVAVDVLFLFRPVFGRALLVFAPILNRPQV